MPKIIMVLLAKSHSVSLLLTHSAALAALHQQASIKALVMRFEPHPTAIISQNVPTHAGEEKIRAHEEGRVDQIRLAYEAWCESHRHSSAIKWHDEEGSPEKIIESCAREVDLIVVARPYLDGDLAEHEAVLAAVFASNRPVLIIPNDWEAPIGKSAAVAWRRDSAAPEALKAALSIFPSLQEVHFLLGHRQHRPAPPAPQLTGCDATTSLHNIEIGKGELSDQLLEYARDLNADLLVVGAATHSSWHILLFGNVTKRLIASCDRPVLMRGVQTSLQ